MAFAQPDSSALKYGFRAGIGLNDLQAKDYKVDGCRVTYTAVQLALRYAF